MTEPKNQVSAGNLERLDSGGTAELNRSVKDQHEMEIQFGVMIFFLAFRT
ncbi:MAG: hypothetical protein ACE5HS_10535 [bacterium]